jgi:hypothetical protein
MSRIEYLEDKCRELEEKTEKLTQLLGNITKEFEELHDLLDRDVSGCFFPNTKVNMDESEKEHELLVTGWYASESGFRWGGKDNMHPTVYFSVFPDKSYKLDMNIFVPKAIAKSPIKILVNDNEIESFVSEGGQLKKTIYIPSNLLESGRLKVVFESDFWDPSKIDNSLESRALSLAFNYLELIES